MADKSYTKLSNVTLEDFRTLLEADAVFNSLVTAQQNTAINLAIEDAAKLLANNGYDYYNFDCIADADLVLAPTASSVANLYEKYLQIKFAVHDGTADVVSQVAGTKVGFALESASYALVNGLACYTINVTGGTIDGHTRIQPPQPSDIGIERVDGTSFKVYAETDHGVFSAWLIKMKES